MADFQYLPPYGVGQPGSPVQQGGGGGGLGMMLPVNFYDPMDALRAGYNQLPQAQYPDGYLGSVRGRREDRLRKEAGQHMNTRSYQRGVHKGERIDQSDYFWPDDQQPDRGLEAQAAGVRQAPYMTALERAMVGGTPIPHGAYGIVGADPRAVNAGREAQLLKMAPNWR